MIFKDLKIGDEFLCLLPIIDTSIMHTLNFNLFKTRSYRTIFDKTSNGFRRNHFNKKRIVLFLIDENQKVRKLNEEI